MQVEYNMQSKMNFHILNRFMFFFFLVLILLFSCLQPISYTSQFPV